MFVAEFSPVPDAGASDAGTDAGLVDGGSVADAGTPGKSSSGCGCTGAPGSNLLAMACGLLALLASGGARRKSRQGVSGVRSSSAPRAAGKPT